MTEVQPPMFEAECYDADDMRLLVNAMAQGTEGVVGNNDMIVTAAASGLAVDVSGGSVFVAGDTAGQGMYLCVNQGSTRVQLAAAGAQARTDLIVATVFDTAFGGASNTWLLADVTGTPGAGVPATPPNSTALATVAVAAGALTVTAGNITDQREKSNAPVWQ